MTDEARLDGCGRPAARRLVEYDSDTHGPLFAVSDEGSAGKVVVDAAYASAKAQALGADDPFTLGVILDGERMTSAGEVPIGPPEYAALSAAARSKLQLTTNVGTRVNVRLTQQLPEFEVTRTSATDSKWVAKVCDSFQQFLHTPDGHPRPLTVRLIIPDAFPLDGLKAVLDKLETQRTAGKIGPADVHAFAALVVHENEIATEEQIRRIEQVMEAAVAAGLTEVALDGRLRKAARSRLGVQGLLNILSPEHLRRLLRKADELGVRLAYYYHFDVETAARTIWTGLSTARENGFAAGKYGLVPLTLEDQAAVMERITRWTSGWTAIPAFYVDTPLLTATDVYDETRRVEGAVRWIRTARGAGATVVLFDCPDRVDPRRLLKSGGEKDVGILDIEDVEHLTSYAKDLGVSILWSGGITSGQAFELAKRKVFGIFSTSSTAAKVAVTAQFTSDPRLPAENEPTEFGVRRMHAIVQAGFLVASLGTNKKLAGSIETITGRLLKAEADAARSEAELQRLNPQLVAGWRVLLALAPEGRVGNLNRGSYPVPPDAVRVFRGRKREDLKHDKFVDKLGRLFMPLTVQMQRIYGLTAYLPAVLPPSKPTGVPDEIALVFYQTQAAYHDAKQCVGGRAYSESHGLVFDMARSQSDFPTLFANVVDVNRPYYLFERSVDWQAGNTWLHVGTRPKSVKEKQFLEGVGKLAAALCESPGERDAVIFCADEDWLVWWEHSQGPGELAPGLKKLTDAVSSLPARMLRMPEGLTEPYLGLSLNAQGDFVNCQFQRV